MQMSKLTVWLCCALFIIAPIAGAAEETPATLVEKAKAIKSFQCKVTNTNHDVTGEHAMRLPDCMLMRFKNKDHRSEFFMRNCIVTTVEGGANPAEGKATAGLVDLRKLSAEGNQEMAILFTVGILKDPYLMFIQLDPAKAQIVERSEVEGLKLYVIESKEFKPLRFMPDDLKLIRFTVGEDGFPRKIVENFVGDRTEETVITDVEVNKAIPDSVFTPPDGLDVDDATQQMIEASRQVGRSISIPPALKALFGPGLSAKKFERPPAKGD